VNRSDPELSVAELVGLRDNPKAIVPVRRAAARALAERDQRPGLTCHRCTAVIESGAAVIRGERPYHAECAVNQALDDLHGTSLGGAA
jgi:hypothetical protein